MGMPATTAGGALLRGTGRHHGDGFPCPPPRSGPMEPPSAPNPSGEREELLLVQHAMEGCSNGEASAAGRPPPLPCIHLLPPYMDSEQQASSVDDDDNQGIHRHDDAPHMVQLGYNLLYRVTATVVVCGIDYNLLSCESVSYL